MNGDSDVNEDKMINDKNLVNENLNCFQDCTDVINVIENDRSTVGEKYFSDCIDKNSVVDLDDMVLAGGYTGIILSQINHQSVNQEQSNTQLIGQPLHTGIDNEHWSTVDLHYRNAVSGGIDHNDKTTDLSDLHASLALTVLRLQQIVKSISNRIENLETRVTEQQLEISSKKVIKQRSWWPCRTAQTTVLLIIWPFAAHLIISAIEKKINKSN